MAFSFLKPKPKPSPLPSRPRPTAVAIPKVMVGNVGAVPALPEAAPLNDEAGRERFYRKLRREPTATELRVGEAAMAWLVALPKHVRPVQCCRAYPHVVNHLAGWWDSAEGLGAYFDDLLNSPRKQRAGFPPAIRAELEALLAHARAEGLVA